MVIEYKLKEGRQLLDNFTNLLESSIIAHIFTISNFTLR